MSDRRSQFRVGRANFIVGQNVRISKEKMKFAKGSEQNYTDELFKISKVIRRTHHPVYVLKDLYGTVIEV